MTDRQGDGDAELQRVRRRQRWRRRLGVLLLVWAGLWMVPAMGLLVLTGDIASVVRLLVYGGLPLGLFLWWTHTHPIELPFVAGPARLAHPPYSPLGRLDRIRDAADQLRERGWLPPGDHDEICARADRLADLVTLDATSAHLGGTATPTVEREILRLHETVVGLLDTAIDTEAVQLGDRDLDVRLRDHLDAIRSRSDAIEELEGRDGQTGTAS